PARAKTQADDGGNLPPSSAHLLTRKQQGPNAGALLAQ
ncbi:MAG: hypothetical protein JWQ75_3901, partial [Pseudarthrobacter sp.]|nr:hypothetical protein [Pseudarthrobacter sp.]